MISLQTLLLAGWRDKLPTILIIAGAVIFACVFIAGMVKGFSRVGKGGFVWGIASVGFILLYKFIDNPFASKWTSGFWGDNCEIIWATMLLLAVVLVVLIGRASLSAIFNPDGRSRRDYDEMGWRKGAAVANTEGFEYELDDEVDVYYTRRKSRYEIARETTPGIVSRLFGGIFAVLNLAVILGAIAVVGLLIVNIFDIFGGVNALLGESFGGFLDSYVFPYAFDALTVGIIFGIACHGFYAGTIGFTRSLLMKVGLILVVVFGLAAPFIDKINDFSIIAGLIERCTSLFDSIEKIPPSLLGQITAGAVIALIGAIVVLVLSFLLGKLMDAIDNTIVLRAIDGALATLIYLALGVALCGILWGGLYCLDVTGILGVKEILPEGSFSLECFERAAWYLGDFADKYLLKFAS